MYVISIKQTLLEEIWKTDHPNYEEDDDQPVTSVPVADADHRSEEHTSELQSLADLVFRLLLEKTNH